MLGKNPNPKIERICKVTITDEHRLESVYYANFEWTKSEEERKKQEALDAEKNKEEEG